MSTPVTDLFALHAQGNPERPAVLEGSAVFTFSQVNNEVNRLVGGLQKLGFQAGDRMVWCGPNSREVLVTIHAGRKLGLVTVPLSYRFNADEMHYIIDNSGATLVIVDAEQAPLIASIRPDLPNLREVVVYRGTEAGFRTWEEVVAAGTDDEPESVGEPTGETMIYTSGTTGKPKGAKRGAADQALVFAMVTELRMTGDEVHLTTGPLYHSGPNAFAFLSHMLGGTVVIMRKFDAREWIRLVTEHRITSTFSAPTQLKRIVSLSDDEIAAGDYSSLHTLIANAAPVPYALKQEVIAKLGDGFLFEVYGSTELGVDTILKPEDQLGKPGSCGKPYGGIEVKAVDDNGATLPPNQPGELYFRTALAMEGYHATDEQLAEAGEGWKSVGDVGSIDEEGYVYISDRKKDMIISGGMNIYPAEIEAVLHQHPDVMDAGVFGIPDDEWGEKVHAVVQPKAGRTLDMADIEGFAAERLAGYKRPRSWEFRDELPRTESGKLLKRLLRDEHWKGRATGV
ncbi:MAG: AMP-binding protein [Acidimicrobiia bacterium]|nr:AMP-binding protein [Acidimicrobiia bacterium]